MRGRRQVTVSKDKIHVYVNTGLIILYSVSFYRLLLCELEGVESNLEPAEDNPDLYKPALMKASFNGNVSFHNLFDPQVKIAVTILCQCSLYRMLPYLDYGFEH